jgi:hypothetical protein
MENVSKAESGLRTQVSEIEKAETNILKRVKFTENENTSDSQKHQRA